MGPMVAGTADISTLANLLEIVSSPDRAKTTLVDLAKQSADAQTAIAQAKAATEDLAKARTEFEAQRAAFKKLQDSTVADFEVRRTDLDRRAAELDKRTAGLDDREKQLALIAADQLAKAAELATKAAENVVKEHALDQ